MHELARHSGRFLSFLMHSGTRYQVHSPFIYDLIGQVIRNRSADPATQPIEALRMRHLSSREVIQKTDFGAGSGFPGKRTYPVDVRHIAKTSLASRRNALRLHHLARYINATRILELGTSLGITTAYLAIAAPDARIISLEGCPELCRMARSGFDALGIRNVEIVEGRFEDRLGDALESLGKVDLLFIDGDHRKGAMLENFERCRSYLHNDSAVLLDDIHHSAGMEEAWNTLAQRADVTVSLDLFRTGWLFFRNESTKEHFRLRYL